MSSKDHEHKHIVMRPSTPPFKGLIDIYELPRDRDLIRAEWLKEKDTFGFSFPFAIELPGVCALGGSWDTVAMFVGCLAKDRAVYDPTRDGRKAFGSLMGFEQFIEKYADLSLLSENLRKFLEDKKVSKPAFENSFLRINVKEEHHHPHTGLNTLTLKGKTHQTLTLGGEAGEVIHGLLSEHDQDKFITSLNTSGEPSITSPEEAMEWVKENGFVKMYIKAPKHWKLDEVGSNPIWYLHGNEAQLWRKGPGWEKTVEIIKEHAPKVDIILNPEK